MWEIALPTPLRIDTLDMLDLDGKVYNQLIFLPFKWLIYSHHGLSLAQIRLYPITPLAGLLGHRDAQRTRGKTRWEVEGSGKVSLGEVK